LLFRVHLKGKELIPVNKKNRFRASARAEEADEDQMEDNPI